MHVHELNPELQTVFNVSITDLNKYRTKYSQHIIYCFIFQYYQSMIHSNIR